MSCCKVLLIVSFLLFFFFFQFYSNDLSFAAALVTSLRKIVLGGEQFGSRPSMTIDVCSERQVQLVLKVD